MTLTGTNVQVFHTMAVFWGLNTICLLEQLIFLPCIHPAYVSPPVLSMQHFKT